MTPDEAVKALLEGKKIRNEGDPAGEYFYMDEDGDILDRNDEWVIEDAFRLANFCRLEWELYEDQTSNFEKQLADFQLQLSKLETKLMAVNLGAKSLPIYGNDFLGFYGEDGNSFQIMESRCVNACIKIAKLIQIPGEIDSIDIGKKAIKLAEEALTGKEASG